MVIEKEDDNNLHQCCEICGNYLERYTKKGRPLHVIFKCGHGLCTDCMKKYTASNVILACLPIKCPHDGCNGKVSSSQA